MSTSGDIVDFNTITGGTGGTPGTYDLDSNSYNWFRYRCKNKSYTDGSSTPTVKIM